MNTILICDDEKDIVNALKIYLSNPEYEFIEAFNGKEALEIVEKTKPDLILLDLMMPVMDGICIKNQQTVLTFAKNGYNILAVLNKDC